MKFQYKPSMRRKLVLMFLGTTLITHLIVGAVAQRTIESHFYDLGVNYISDKFSAMDKDSGITKASPNSVESFDNRLSKVWKLEDNQITYQNSDLQLPLDKANFFLTHKGDTYSQQWKDNGNHYLATSFCLSPRKTLVVGVNINHHIEFFKTINTMIFWFTLVVSLLAGLYSVMIVNNGLKPLKKFEEYLAQIRPGHLDIRIPTEKLPAELETLSEVQNSMLDRLDLGFQRLSDFSADIAHELRTPLTNMTTQTQVMLSHERDASEYRDILGSNLEELERITKTINDTLYLAQAENSLLYQNKEVLNLEKELSQLIEYHSIVSEDKEVTIALKGQGELYVDKHMFQRAINNLLSNAIRHSSDNSTIDVTVDQADETLIITVTNKGDTISKESLPFIFDRFYRGDCSRGSDCGAGSGLGLAITKSIIETYDGSITVQSVDGITSFEIRFPQSTST